jgi:L-2-hydroxyglutarate oxidase LhgO
VTSGLSDVPEVAIIGGGIVGMACGAELARAGRPVVVLERHAHPGQETTSRNSEVIHAGIYYPQGSLKALACIEGRDLLYERCARLGLPHRRIGKLIVASEPAEIPVLEGIGARAQANGAGGITWLDAAEVRRCEPRVRACAAVWSPNTGIVDAHALLASYQAELEACGSSVVLRTRVIGLERCGGLWRVETEDADGERFNLEVPYVVNAAGLWSDRVAELAGLDVDALGWRLHWCKGDYFSAAPGLGRLTRHLVYPVPVHAGLGVHVTLDLGGRCRFGPDTQYVESLSYEVDPGKAASFAEAVRRYLPEVRPEHLQPEMAGIRPKLQGPRDPFRDFIVAESGEHGAPGLVHLVGIESPGLTASASLARRVAALIPS